MALLGAVTSCVNILLCPYSRNAGAQCYQVLPYCTFVKQMED